MARDLDTHRLSSPQVVLWRMIIFLVIVGFIASILYRQILVAFSANPGLNSLIIGVLLLGILLALRQVVRLFREVRWVNSFRVGDANANPKLQPRLLGPMAALLRDRGGKVEITPELMRSILDSISMRLDENRDITRYIGGTLVFLGLLGTFWGLTETVASIGNTIKALDVKSGDVGVIFDDFKTGLAAPLAGMSVAFSSSLFGLSGSLIIGFLDLQASQAQNRFYTQLEDWLSAVTEINLGDAFRNEGPLGTIEGLRVAIERLNRSVQDGGSTRTATTAMANLAEGVQGLVNHMRTEQQMIRAWVEEQAEESREMRRMMARIAPDDMATQWVSEPKRAAEPIGE
jgi:biopolymer transport protein ExbB/TolQ